jgi:hypothetical protein
MPQRGNRRERYAERKAGAQMIAHTFIEETHQYIVPGKVCLATSDILQMNGLCDYGAVPLGVLEEARWVGTQLHRAIHYLEDGDLDLDDVDHPKVRARLDRYLEWKAESGFIPIGPFEKPLVYEMNGICVGCHLDLRGYIPGSGLWILDPKGTHPTSGAAKNATWLRWRLQLQSYKEANEFDTDFWAAARLYDEIPISKAILHLHPSAKDVFIPFRQDDSEIWSAAVTMARAKLESGYKRPEHS